MLCHRTRLGQQRAHHAIPLSASQVNTAKSSCCQLIKTQSRWCRAFTDLGSDMGEVFTRAINDRLLQTTWSPRGNRVSHRSFRDQTSSQTSSTKFWRTLRFQQVSSDYVIEQHIESVFPAFLTNVIDHQGKSLREGKINVVPRIVCTTRGWSTRHRARTRDWANNPRTTSHYHNSALPEYRTSLGRSLHTSWHTIIITWPHLTSPPMDIWIKPWGENNLGLANKNALLPGRFYPSQRRIFERSQTVAPRPKFPVWSSVYVRKIC